MEQWIRENIQNFMIGLEIVLVLCASSIIVLYFYLRHKVKQKNKAKGEE